MTGFKGLFAELEGIYAQCPVLPCTMCAKCCTSPHLTLVEFLRLLDWLLKEMPREKLIALVRSEPEISQRMQGHLQCPLLEGNRCLAYQGRGLVCHLMGIPKLNMVFGLSEPLCADITEEQMPKPFGVDDIEEAMDRVATLNGQYYEYLSEPYFLDALNLQSWFAVCLDPGISQSFFLNIRKIIRDEYDLAFLEEHYQNHTRLREKIDLIDQFFEFNAQQKAPEALFCMQQVRSAFPNTGAYYVNQAGVYIRFMQDLITVVNAHK